MTQNFIRLSALSLILTAVLTGCSGTTTRSLNAGYDDVAKVEFMQYAGAATPVFMEVINSPFAEGDMATAGRAAAESDGVLVGINVSFTADEGEASQSQFRVVHLFSPDRKVSINRICGYGDGNVPSPALNDSETMVFSAFCSHDEPITGSVSKIAALNGLDDPGFRTLMRDALRTMFSANDPRYDRQPFLLVAERD